MKNYITTPQKTQHDVTSHGTFTYHRRKAKNWKTCKHKNAGILNIITVIYNEHSIWIHNSKKNSNRQ